MFKLNKNTLIKTPTGFKTFSGIQKVYKPFYHWIIFDDETEIKCSENHSFGSEMPSLVRSPNRICGKVLHQKYLEPW